MRKSWVCFFICFLFLAPFAFNASAWPKNTQQKNNLSEVERTIQASKKEQMQLERQLASLHKRIVELRQEEKKLNRKIQLAELKASLLEKDQQRAHIRQKKLETELRKNYPHFSHLISSFVHQQHTPPQVLIANASSPERLFHTSIVLEATLSLLEQQITRYKNSLKELRAQQKLLAEKEEIIAKTETALQAQYKILKSKMDEKKRLHSISLQKRKKITERISDLSKKAKDLRGLIEAIEREELVTKQKKSFFSQTPLKGHFILPIASAHILQEFGAENSFGIKSQGIKLIQKNIGDGVVEAPYNGTILFAGPFRNYGNILIIDHGQGYHSFLAGLGKLKTRAGDVILQGEPIGELTSQDGKDPVLYFEVRHNNKPINPHLVF